jgi:hypothetical protein
MKLFGYVGFEFIEFPVFHDAAVHGLHFAEISDQVSADQQNNPLLVTDEDAIVFTD